ncbi:MAG: adenine phosphoribosyltransferase [Sclerophora amabilis]|nr:MAG: adenine phosphoribosyltransferase [Sclerophora amabilis]
MPDSTSSHPPRTKPDATTAPIPAKVPGQPSSSTPSSSELSGLQVKLRRAVRQFPDFPSKGILFEDIFPIFADPELHEALLRALELHVLSRTHSGGQLHKISAGGSDGRGKSAIGKRSDVDVVLGLEARGFMFGPSLALRLGASFVPVRKRGKLPGPTETATYEKEYGTDFFEIQKGAVTEGQKVLIVDDLIATGGSAAAAGSLVKRSGGVILSYIFILELDFLHGRDKLDAPVYTLLSSQDKETESTS